ncbi:hypothetical protein GCM10025876_13660 [Demequina litorisediminis]|uniref:YdbS-like PH domain-containing protein n=1 Tax=Demequina litorisediminis TaxID=1849022 RepID=A0ABQ6IDB6_9MICO|nr:hypothetical protein GCM10025876_13660 [Demequina litorisediminis]
MTLRAPTGPTFLARLIPARLITWWITLALPLAGLVVIAALTSPWVFTGVAVLLAVGLWISWIIYRQVTAHAWIEREEDLIVKRGRMWRSVTVVPYGRMQYVEVEAGPLSRAFGIAKVQAPHRLAGHRCVHQRSPGGGGGAPARPPVQPRRGAGGGSVMSEPTVYRAPREWTRLHPVSPLIGGWAVFGVVASIALYNYAPSWTGPDPAVQEAAHWLWHSVVWLVVGAVVLIALAMGFGFLQWRVSEYRLSDVAVEHRKGIVFKQHKQARLDRVQAIDVVQPLLARIFGFASLKIEVAGGENSGIALEYLRLGDAEAMRNELLALAAGVKRAKAEGRDATVDAVLTADAVAGPQDADAQASASVGADGEPGEAYAAAGSLRDLTHGVPRGVTETAAAPEREVFALQARAAAAVDRAVVALPVDLFAAGMDRPRGVDLPRRHQPDRGGGRGVAVHRGARDLRSAGLLLVAHHHGLRLPRGDLPGRHPAAPRPAGDAPPDGPSRPSAGGAVAAVAPVAPQGLVARDHQCGRLPGGSGGRLDAPAGRDAPGGADRTVAGVARPR